MPITLYADRFLLGLALGVIDAATGAAVTIRQLGPETRARVVAWLDRCATLSRLRHPGLVPMIDYGFTGPGERFEVLACPESSAPIDRRRVPMLRAAEDRESGRRTLESVIAFLQDKGLSPGGLGPRSLVRVDGRLHVVPDAETGMPLEPPRHRTERLRARCTPSGIEVQPRRVIDELLEILDGEQASPQTVVQLIAPPGSGGTTTLGLLAREARLRGFVPMSTLVVARLLDEGPLSAALAGCLAHRHVLLLQDDSGTDDLRSAVQLGRCLMAPGVIGAARSVAVVVTRRPAPQLPSVAMDRLSPEAVARMLGRIQDARTTRLQRIVARAGGRPGLVLSTLGMSSLGPATPRPVWDGAFGSFHDNRSAVGARATMRAPALVRERIASYDAEASAPGCESTSSAGAGAEPGHENPLPSGAAGSSKPWNSESETPGPGEGQLSGSWARAERALREARAACQRRGLRSEAASCGIELGVLLARRGRLAEAMGVLDDTAQALARAAGLPQLLVKAAACLGFVQGDLGRLREAEATLRAARAVAARASLGEDRTLVDIALARVLYWQDRLREAWLLIEPAIEQPSPIADGPVLTGGSSLVVHERAVSPLAWNRMGPAETAINIQVLAGVVGARIAVVIRGPEAALQIAREALCRARATNRPLELALGHYAAGIVRAALGDVEGLAEDIRRGLGFARRAGAPLLSLRLRILPGELPGRGLGGAGIGGVAPLQAAGSRRYRSCRLRYNIDRLPPLLAARARLARPAASPREESRSVAHWARTAGARRLLGEALASAGKSPGEEVARLLEHLHEAEDERAALARLAGELRALTRACGVSVFGVRARVLDVLATAGRAGSQAAAERAVLIGAPVSLGDHQPGCEPASRAERAVAVPVRHARETIGALVCRWTPDVDVDADHARSLVVAAAAAIGPMVQLWVDRQMPGGVLQAAAPWARAILGSSRAIVALREAIARAAAAPFPVLVEGESGTGKELVARAIHAASERRGRKFCGLNCAALTDDLLEAELFGHAKGAFTGALAARPGLFEEADGGVLLLDEVSELTPRAQAKLLRVIQEREVRRVGENFPRAIDVRIVSATNRLLRGEVAAGRFRQDLCYRLDVIRLAIPPLRERVEDVPELAAHFWKEATGRLGSRAVLTPAAVSRLARHPWPGNVRELQNVLAALAVRAPRAGRVGAGAVSDLLLTDPDNVPALRLEVARQELERRMVTAALARAGGRCSAAASELGLTRQGLVKMMARLGIANEGDPRFGLRESSES